MKTGLEAQKGPKRAGSQPACRAAPGPGAAWRRALITGATGFVGSHLVKAWCKAHPQNRAVIFRRPSSSLELLQGCAYEDIQGSLFDVGDLTRAMCGVDVVFHLAGVVAYSRLARARMERVNVEAVRSLLQAAQEAKVPKLVHMSSIVAVGANFSAQSQPLNEASSYNLQHLDLGYHETKRRGEALVLAAARAGKVNATVLNPSVIQGAGDKNKGSRRVHRAVSRGRMPFYPPGGASLVDIEEVAGYCLAAVQKGKPGERYILTRENITIKKMFCDLAKSAGARPPRIGLSARLIKFWGHLGDGIEKLTNREQPVNSEVAQTACLFHWYDGRKAQEQLL